jgi:hypothetical protein
MDFGIYPVSILVYVNHVITDNDMEQNKSLTPTLLILLAAGQVNAALIDRGGGLIYDTVLDVTWLQDADYSKTSGYDSDGRMNWNTATAWADGLTYYDTVRDTLWDDWRLPTVVDTGSSGCDFSYSGTDCGFNVDTSSSEMASLFYDALGNLGAHDTDGSEFQADSWFTHTGPFINLQSISYYWTGLEYAPIPSTAWYFDFRTGLQGGSSDKSTNEHFAWAVRDGDVAEVPEPSIIILMLTGIIGIGFIGRRKALSVS